MKLARIGLKGFEIPVIIGPENEVRSLKGIIDDISGEALSSDSIASLANVDLKSLPIIKEPYRFGPCVGSISQFICVGLNYADHAKESGMEVPAEPILFMKSPSSICGAYDDVILPKNSRKVDWEVEMGIVIGSRCSYVEENNAQKHIAGYCVINDISERAFQLEGTGQWVKGKSADTFGPIGPWLVTQDEVENVHGLDIWLNIDDEPMQGSNTSQLIFNVNFLVSYISQFMTLNPGDIISTGTPFGVGLGLSPPRYLKPGENMELGITGLGVQRQKTVEYNAN